ncbi:MAG: hypothetical protein ACKVRN_07270 [Pyrinomonadaceae bacterium]
MARKKRKVDDDDEELARRLEAMNYQQHAAFLLNQYEVMKRNDFEIAKQLAFTEEDVEDIKRQYDELKPWADYERFVFSVLDRDLVADAKAVKLFDNTKDARDRSDEPEIPENLKDQADLLWPFD